MNKQNRRKFLKLSALSGAFLGLPIADSYARADIEQKLEDLTRPRPARGTSVMGLRVEPIDQVKVAFIGLGNRGPGHLKHVLALYPKAKITAISDIRKERTDHALEILKDSGQKPAVYAGTADAWKEMVRRDDIDLVIIATPWDDHVPMCVYAMEQGKHVAVEVPAAVTLEGCWQLVDTAEATQRNCMMMENVCYGDEELWILNMVEHGVFGTLTHAEAAYIHDLRSQMFSKTGYYNQWRIRHHIRQDGNLYPTHGLGPVAQYLGIERGDRFDHMVSMSSLEAALSEHSLNVESDNEFYNRQDFMHGDMSNTLIKTAKGRTILVQHDVVTPRPYNRINALAGTKGYHEGYPSRLSLEEKGGHKWLNEEEYKEMREKYRHPIWGKMEQEIAKHGGHGGMDFVQVYRLIDCLNRGLPLDMDVYDGADWSVVVPLSKLSVELGSAPLKFPDFTRGKWQGERPQGIMANL
ncbi:Gfo/Idh/MocA family protein [Flavilitoribacter nigricans]|uniref:Alpha-N-acetylgalactosaminidase n=1 Tax=Flavilitoribacter nigricans (strain ATCC 23147 / DSM 23189 / NBRC 102662 / NCIMB 1420 / SS-2) TaxID=1122177 RepID=A0A2D0NLG0_FLAN2|nr:Gfo/Idh/MocA family oxidoreductase [Flavilitoribacter nigricans]PHN08583.1 alpha-N-acetylgalactosaminidase [Flavilitoribacter nigricans DSM 23189 = NBRC 102662]